MGSPRVPPNAAGEILLPRGCCTELGKSAVCILGSLGPRDPGGEEAGGTPSDLGTSRACGCPMALSKESLKLLLGDKAGRTGGAGNFGEARMPLALSQTQNWLWAPELPATPQRGTPNPTCEVSPPHPILTVFHPQAKQTTRLEQASPRTRVREASGCQRGRATPTSPQRPTHVCEPPSFELADGARGNPEWV